MYTEISKISVHSRHPCRNDSTSKPPVRVSKNFKRFNEARLQAVSSRNMYSEHGLLALIRPSLGQVCHSFTVLSYCTPGSAHDQAAKAISSHNSRAFSVLCALGSRPSCLAFSFSVRQ